MTPRLLERYRNEIVPKLLDEFSYRNVHQVPRVEKVVVNVGVPIVKAKAAVTMGGAMLPTTCRLITS